MNDNIIKHLRAFKIKSKEFPSQDGITYVIAEYAGRQFLVEYVKGDKPANDRFQAFAAWLAKPTPVRPSHTTDSLSQIHKIVAKVAADTL